MTTYTSSATSRRQRTTSYALGIEFAGNRWLYVFIVHDALQFLHVWRSPVGAACVVVHVQDFNKSSHGASGIERIVPGETAVLIEVARIASAMCLRTWCR